MLSKNMDYDYSQPYYDLAGVDVFFKRRRRNIKIKAVLSLMLCIILAGVGGVMVYFYNTIAAVNYEYIPNGNSTKLPGSNNEGVINDENSDILQFEPSDSSLLNDPKILNVMLFGEDDAKDAEFGRSDTMILASIDNRHNKIKLSSFMRDTKVEIPLDDGTTVVDKINMSYNLGGPALTIKTIESNFGIDIDRYVVVDFESFTEIIDIFGGIEISLTAQEIDYINWQSYMNNQVDTRDELPMVPGLTKLNGRQALWYARDRDTPTEDGQYDWARTSRQRNILETLFSSLKDATLTQLIEVVSKIGPMTTTNFKTDEITTLVSNALTYLSYEFDEQSVPHDGTWTYENTDQSYITIYDWSAAKLELAKFVFETGIKVPETSDAQEETTEPETTISINRNRLIE